MTHLAVGKNITLIALAALVLAGTACQRKASSEKGASMAQQALPAFEAGSTFATARSLHEAGRFQDAIQRYKDGLREKEGPYHPLAKFHLADAYFQLKDVPRALHEYRNAWTAQLAPGMDSMLPEAMKEEAHVRFLRLVHYEQYTRQSGVVRPDIAVHLADAQAVVALLANPQYVLKDSEVFDKQTGLTWKRCLVGQTMDDGVRCTGDATRLTWEQIAHINSAGWRAATAAELLTLADNSRFRAPQTDTAVFPGLEGHYYYWSSDPQRAGLGTVVRFGGAPVSEDRHPISSHFPVRLVRDGR